MDCPALFCIGRREPALEMESCWNELHWVAAANFPACSTDYDRVKIHFDFKLAPEMETNPLSIGKERRLCSKNRSLHARQNS
jgi:hypothetical protein